jgi:hypothetical protein
VAETGIAPEARDLIDRFNAKDIECRKGRWPLLANVHEMHKEVVVSARSNE